MGKRGSERHIIECWNAAVLQLYGLMVERIFCVSKNDLSGDLRLVTDIRLEEVNM